MKKIMVLVLIIISFAACKDQTDPYTVAVRQLNEAVYASGEVLPAEYENLFVGTPERILKILANEGDTVKTGDILVVMGTPSENIQLNILSDQVALARQNAQENEAILTELREKIRLAQSRYLQDSVNALRYQELVLDKAVSDTEAEQARIQAETSFTEYRSLLNQYTSARNDLRNKLLNTEKELAALKHTREGKMLSSSIPGKVYSINLLEGELARPEEPILLIGSKDRFKLELLVDERDIIKIKLGQKVYFETNAFTGRQFEARINKIIPVLQKETRSFKVEAAVLSEEVFYPQSSVEANILVRENVQALVIPSEYLLSGDSVNVQRENGTERIKVEKGTTSNDWIEIKTGLKEGDVVSK